MDTLVGIGDFSKMTYLSIKALRHYHDVGLLEPADVDPATGHRRYTTPGSGGTRHPPLPGPGHAPRGDS
jgi:hypothetical protein